MVHRILGQSQVTALLQYQYIMLTVLLQILDLPLLTTHCSTAHLLHVSEAMLHHTTFWFQVSIPLTNHLHIHIRVTVHYLTDVTCAPFPTQLYKHVHTTIGTSQMIDHHGVSLSKQHAANLQLFVAHSKVCHY